MDATRFDTIAKLFADRRLSRRHALTQGGAGLAAGASPPPASPPPRPGRHPGAAAASTRPGSTASAMLFLQSFQSRQHRPKRARRAATP